MSKKFILNTLRPRQNGRRFADDIFKCIFVNENAWILIKMSLKFVPKGPINNIPALVQIMAWRRPGDKPLSEAMLVSLPTHICVSRPQWVNFNNINTFSHSASNNSQTSACQWEFPMRIIPHETDMPSTHPRIITGSRHADYFGFDNQNKCYAMEVSGIPLWLL